MSPVTRGALHSAVAAGAVAFLVGVVPATAGAAFPGSNGRIAFEMGGAIYSIQPSGGGLQTLTKGPDDHSPRWSPDGKTIVFERAGDLWTMRVDGSHEQQFT